MKIIFDNTNRELTYEPLYGQSILKVLQSLGIRDVESPCGGNGSCKKCLVKIFTHGHKTKALACQTMARDVDAVILKEVEPGVIAEKGDCYLYSPDSDDIVLTPKVAYGLAIDIGTTTVVCHLLELKSGKRLSTVSGSNAQKVFGGDVITRIQASMEGRTQDLHTAIVEQINDMICKLTEQAYVSLEQILLVSVAGNTTMQHLLAGFKPDSIGIAPFKPLSLFGDYYLASDLGLKLNQEAKVYILPAIAGYVGGDITGDMIAIRMQEEEKPVLLLDIGTNGEMALGSKNKIVTCATAAGPAFEGASISMGMPALDGAVSKVWIENKTDICTSTIGKLPSVGICGSGLIDALAVMLELEVIDETGCFADEDDLPEALAWRMKEEDDGICFYIDGNVKITQADIRKLQLAKAAIAAGIQVLLKEMQLNEIDVSKLILAGGFGSYMNPESAARIGLIPNCLLEKTISVGNAAGEGAVSALLSKKARQDLASLNEIVCYEELSTNKHFNDYYMDAMMFE